MTGSKLIIDSRYIRIFRSQKIDDNEFTNLINLRVEMELD